MADTEKKMWGIHTQNDDLFLKKDKIAIGWEEMGDLTPEEEVAYLKARNHYLEEMLKAQKKMQSELEEMFTSSNSRK